LHYSLYLTDRAERNEAISLYNVGVDSYRAPHRRCLTNWRMYVLWSCSSFKYHSL